MGDVNKEDFTYALTATGQFKKDYKRYLKNKDKTRQMRDTTCLLLLTDIPIRPAGKYCVPYRSANLCAGAGQPHARTFGRACTCDGCRLCHAETIRRQANA